MTEEEEDYSDHDSKVSFLPLKKLQSYLRRLVTQHYSIGFQKSRLAQIFLYVKSLVVVEDSLKGSLQSSHISLI